MIAGVAVNHDPTLAVLFRLTMRERSRIIIDMNKLNTAKRVQIVSALVEGNSLRATSRMSDVSINTVTKLLVDLGTACAAFHDKTVRGLTSRRIECDEIWAFCYAKAKNVAAAKSAPEWAGDVWTWVAIDADSKLIPSWLVGTRDLGSAYDFMHDLADRLANRVQLTTDGHRPYLEAVESAFNLDIDYAMLVKIYGADPEPQKRYSPAKCQGCEIRPITGQPNPKHISTSYIERQNLTLRMGSRRFTRLTNGFSKKVENHAHAVALHYTHYNWCRIHKSLRVTPAIQAGLTDHVWSIEELIGLLDSN